LVARNANEVVVGSGGVCMWWASGCQFCVGPFGRNLALLAFVLVSFNNGVWSSQNGSRASFCKDNAVINCVTLQHKKGSFSSTLTGHMLS
jgi:hypothetical protein